MNEKECKDLYPKANRCFSHSSQFPKEALEKIPSELHSAIDNGNSEFFIDLKESFPKLYEVLTTKCSDITLLESVSKSLALNSLGDQRLSYFWGLKCDDKHISVGIPSSNPSSKIRELIYPPFLDALPKEFESFYEKMEGIGINDDIVSMGIKDLPLAFADFCELEVYLENTEQDIQKSDKIYTDFPDGDIRVFIECSSGDLILCDLASSSRDLYILENSSDGEYRVIENPIETLDEYFAKALLK